MFPGDKALSSISNKTAANDFVFQFQKTIALVFILPVLKNILLLK